MVEVTVTFDGVVVEFLQLKAPPATGHLLSFPDPLNPVRLSRWRIKEVVHHATACASDHRVDVFVEPHPR